MKNLKKVLLTGTLTLASIVTMSAISNAATVKITGEVVNVREKNSTDSKVVAQLSENIECEYLGEEGEWYKIKYKNHTGYVSKQYTKLVDETSDNKTNSNTQNDNKTNNQTTTDNKLNNDNKENNQANASNDNKNNNQASTNNDNKDNNKSNTNNNNDDSKKSDDSSKEDNVKLRYKKFKDKTAIKILPLIYSNKIEDAKKNDEVLILAETSGWSYIQTDEVSGWVRTDTLGEEKTVTTGGNSTQGNTTTSTTSTEKKGYVSEESVNMRKDAGTGYSVVKVLRLNEEVTILDEKNGWYKVKSGNDTGYILKDLISNSKKVTSRSLSEPRTNKEDEDELDKNESKTTMNEDSKTNNSTNSNNKVVTTSNAEESSSVKKTTETASANKTNSTSNKTSSNESSKIKETDVIAYAKKFLGYKYVYGGDGSNKTFDCSGFTMFVYKHFGVNLPHYTVSQYNSSKGTKIKKQSDLKMGDIVFLTDYVTGEPCGHAGIYIGDGDFIHADTTVMAVNISNLNGIYKGRFCGALRIIK